jgi:hypothetical protein
MEEEENGVFDEYNERQFPEENLMEGEENGVFDEEYTEIEVHNEVLFSNFEENFQSKSIEEIKLNSFCGDYGPYFPNATTFMLFAWCSKHLINKFLFIVSYHF